MKRFNAILLLIMDAIFINAGIILAFLIRFRGTLPARNFVPYLKIWYILLIFYLGCFYLSGLYRQRRQRLWSIFLSVAKSMNLATLFAVGFAYVFRHRFGAFPTTVFFLSWLINIFLITIYRFLLFRKEMAPKRLLIIAGEEESGPIVTNLQQDRNEYNVIAILRELNEELPSIIKEKEIEEVIIARGENISDRLVKVIESCRGTGVKFRLVPDLYEIFFARVNIADLNGSVFVELETEPISGFYWDIKRAMDIVLSLLGLIILSPLFILIPVLIKLDSPGSVFFKQDRVGKDGRIFTIYKFRSMFEDAEKDTGPVFAGEEDSRITRIGRFLRNSHLDEIPQLFNILKGEMSFIGPRPERPYFIEKFKKEVPGYMQRLSVRPGLTGLAQVYASYYVSPHNKLRYDLLYIRNYSPLLDLQILYRTIQILWRRR